MQPYLLLALPNLSTKSHSRQCCMLHSSACRLNRRLALFHPPKNKQPHSQYPRSLTLATKRDTYGLPAYIDTLHTTHYAAPCYFSIEGLHFGGACVCVCVCVCVCLCVYIHSTDRVCGSARSPPAQTVPNVAARDGGPRALSTHPYQQSTPFCTPAARPPCAYLEEHGGALLGKRQSLVDDLRRILDWIRQG